MMFDRQRRAMFAKMKLKQGWIPDKRFDPKQLKMGMKVEVEHSDDPDITKQIAKAHLLENPRYYTYLKDMEEKFEDDEK